MPADCKQQVDEDLTPEQTAGIRIHYARRIEDVLRVALPHTKDEAEHDEEVREEVLSATV
jgi:ATP-dependent Lon protease